LRGAKLLQYLILGAILVAVPLVVHNAYVMQILIMLAIYGILVLGLEIILGQTGLFSLGHAAFYGMGAYTSALLALRLGWPIWLATIGAMVTSALFGAAIGFPVLRLRGDYLAIATLGFGEIFGLIMNNWNALTRGPMGLPGIPRPYLFGQPFDRTMYYYMIVALFFIALFLAFHLCRSFLGRAFRSIRDDEDAAEFMGINITKYKILSFVIGGIFAGLAGSLFAHYITFISPDTFTYVDSETLLAMVFLGGAGTVIGPVIGAVVLVLFPEIFQFLVQWDMLVIGVIMVLVMVYRPQGIWTADIRWPWIRKVDPALAVQRK
jgi:branched-chain amino acid transport system permease protein